MKLTRCLALGVLFAACGSEHSTRPTALEDARFPTGSASLLASRNYDAVYSVNTDNDSISRLDLGTGLLQEVTVGHKPARLARAGDRIFVSLPYERAVAVLEDVDGTLSLVGSIEVGVEPFGLVASEAGDRLYVACAMSNRVDEIDAQELRLVQSFPVANQPRWLALNPNRKMLYVGSAMRGTLSSVDLDSGEVTSRELPTAVESRRDSQLDRSLSVNFARRITGDLVVSPDGEDLYVPGLYADDTTTVPPATDPEDSFGGGGGGGYAGSTDSPRMNPAVVEVPLDGDGTLELDRSSPIDASANLGFDSPSELGFRVSSFPTSLTVSPDGRLVLATLQGSDAVLVLSRLPVSMGSEQLQATTQRRGILELRPRTLIVTGSAPGGVCYVSEDAGYVHSAFDRSVGRIALVEAVPHDEEALRTGTIVYQSHVVEVAPGLLPDDVERGRRLFFSARDSRMVSVGAGVSCATCHLEGRNDGITWPLDAGPRQTPSLAGAISATAPFTWSGAVATVTDDVVKTSQGRMGGFGLTVDEATDVAAWVDTVELPDSPGRGWDDPEIALGAEIFARPEVACGTCHSGTALTDNDSHNLFGMSANTPALLGISATAPYLHDGSKKSLRDIVQHPDGMGDTSGLSGEEQDALVRFLESL